LKTDIDFLGRKALDAQRAGPLKKRLACFVVDDPGVILLGRETIFRDGRTEQAGLPLQDGATPLTPISVTVTFRAAEASATRCYRAGVTSWKSRTSASLHVHTTH
jgi:glycine cleavage system aminomethyltransferase T